MPPRLAMPVPGARFEDSIAQKAALRFTGQGRRVGSAGWRVVEPGKPAGAGPSDRDWQRRGIPEPDSGAVRQIEGLIFRFG